MNENGIRDPVSDLERRWAAEKSPQLGLQLAEEHRRRGNLGRAIEVLRKGLDHHPGHVAARVALGRYLLESDDPSGASAALQSVVDEDPTHLVANKLLVSAAADLGETERARRQLETYETLNAGDPEVEALRLRLGSSPPVEVPPAKVPGESEDLEDASRPSRRAERRVTRSGDPFTEVVQPVDRDHYRQALWEEGIFGSATGTSGPEARQSRRSEEATVILGRLYLEQGHLADAERIFRAVLEEDPNSREALDGLRKATGAVVEITAQDLVDPELLSVGSSVERKRLVLESYRERLRNGLAGV